MTKTRKGFTLIELLVVIAIIGILAAMVFPVFARARESARKVVCLSNVKNIALAVQMYLADNNDTLPPAEHRQDVFDYLATGPGGGAGCDASTAEYRGYTGNPYLRWPVVLDEYVKNREVWRCPSAKVEYAAGFILPGPDWLQTLRDNEGSWGQVDGWNFGFGVCMRTFPSGWGGAVTDSILQQRLGGSNVGFASVEQTAHKAFVASIGTNYGITNGRDLHTGVKLAAVNDPVNYVIVADCGVVDYVGEVTKLAYPEMCCVECSWFLSSEADRAADPDTYIPGCVEFHASPEWAADNDRKKMSTRHLGGVNIGYLDGHASWINSTALLNRYLEGDLDGMGIQCVGFTQEMASDSCGFEWGEGYPFLP